jgi:hypothetical protein
MPTGADMIRQAQREAAARQVQFENAGPGIRYFRPEEGKTYTVRFCEEHGTLRSVYTHAIEMAGRRYPVKAQCLDQDDKGVACPGCLRSKPRSQRMTSNVIWYDAPKFQREEGKDGKPGKIKKDDGGQPLFVITTDPETGQPKVATEPCIATWEMSMTTGGILMARHDQFDGLTSRIFTVSRLPSSDPKKPIYMIDPVEERAPEPWEIKLWESRPDPADVIRKMSYGEMERAYGGIGESPSQPSFGAGGQPSQPPADNAFARAAQGAVNRGAFG